MLRLLMLLSVLAAISWGQEALPDEVALPGTTVILAPLPDSTVSGNEPLEVSALLSGVEGLTVSLLVDGADVTSRADITGDYVFYISPEPPSEGIHSVTIFGTLNGDTLLSENWSFAAAKAELPLESEALPWDLSLNLGWRYANCDRDTAGLGLSTPIGHHPTGEASFYGPLWGGLVQGDISYDPSYDADPHGLLQLTREGLEVSLGEFFPALSSLAFADALPLGLLGKARKGRLTFDLTACRTASADTTTSSFAQYLYGGRAGVSLGDSLFVSLGYLQGHDQPSSLPDSVRFRAITLVLADTIFGLTNTLTYVDSLHPASNRIGWLSASKSLGLFSLDLELAGTRTETDIGQTTKGWGYQVKLARYSPDLEASLVYSSTDDGFRSFGSPYLETDKNELEGLIQASWPGKVRTTLHGNVYKAHADSAPGLGWSAGAGGSLSHGALTSLSLRFDYSHRPYQTYRYQSRSLSAGIGLSFFAIRFNAGYGYTSSSSPTTTQSHSASAGASRRLYRRLAEAFAGIQYYQVRSAAGGTDREKLTLTASLSGDLSSSFGYRLQFGRIAQTDRIDPNQSYRQEMASAGISFRF